MNELVCGAGSTEFIGEETTGGPEDFTMDELPGNNIGETTQLHRFLSQHLFESTEEVDRTESRPVTTTPTKQQGLRPVDKDDEACLNTLAFYYWLQKVSPAGQTPPAQAIWEISHRYPDFVREVLPDRLPEQTLHDPEAIEECSVWLLEQAREQLDATTFDPNERLIDVLVHFGRLEVPHTSFDAWRSLALGRAIKRCVKTAPIPNAFPDDQGRIPSNPLLAAGLAAIWKGGSKARLLVSGWRENQAERPVYVYRKGKQGRVIVYPNAAGSASTPFMRREDAWKLVEGLSPFTGDVILAVLAQLCEPSTGDRPKYPMLQPVRITADAILKYKGIQRWGERRIELRQRVSEEMERLRTLRFDIQKIPAENPKTGSWDAQGVSWQDDRLFDIVKVEQYQETLFGEREQVGVSWMVRPGQWAYYWLNSQGTLWIGRLARTLLELDHRGTALTKKIGQRVALLHSALRIEEPLTLRIDRLLEDVGELPEPASRTKNWAGRTRERFDKALLELREHRVFTAVEWPEGFMPGSGTRHSGWVNEWLGSKVSITLPSALPQLPEGKIEHIEETRIFDGVALKKVRKTREVKQKELAGLLNISVPYLSQLENGKRQPSDVLERKIQEWLSRDR